MSKKFSWKQAIKSITAIGSIMIGMAIGGNVLYNKGLYAGGERIYDAGCDIYDDFEERMADYANRDSSNDENSEEDS